MVGTVKDPATGDTRQVHSDELGSVADGSIVQVKDQNGKDLSVKKDTVNGTPVLKPIIGSVTDATTGQTTQVSADEVAKMADGTVVQAGDHTFKKGMDQGKPVLKPVIGTQVDGSGNAVPVTQDDLRSLPSGATVDLGDKVVRKQGTGYATLSLSSGPVQADKPQITVTPINGGIPGSLVKDQQFQVEVTVPNTPGQDPPDSITVKFSTPDGTQRELTLTSNGGMDRTHYTSQRVDLERGEAINNTDLFSTLSYAWSGFSGMRSMNDGDSVTVSFGDQQVQFKGYDSSAKQAVGQTQDAIVQARNDLNSQLTNPNLTPQQRQTLAQRQTMLDDAQRSLQNTDAYTDQQRGRVADGYLGAAANGTDPRELGSQIQNAQEQGHDEYSGAVFHGMGQVAMGLEQLVVSQTPLVPTLFTLGGMDPTTGEATTTMDKVMAVTGELSGATLEEALGRMPGGRYAGDNVAHTSPRIGASEGLEGRTPSSLSLDGGNVEVHPQEVATPHENTALPASGETPRTVAPSGDTIPTSGPNAPSGETRLGGDTLRGGDPATPADGGATQVDPGQKPTTGPRPGETAKDYGQRVTDDVRAQAAQRDATQQPAQPTQPSDPNAYGMNPKPADPAAHAVTPDPSPTTKLGGDGAATVDRGATTQIDPAGSANVDRGATTQVDRSGTTHVDGGAGVDRGATTQVDSQVSGQARAAAPDAGAKRPDWMNTPDHELEGAEHEQAQEQVQSHQQTLDAARKAGVDVDGLAKKNGLDLSKPLDGQSDALQKTAIDAYNATKQTSPVVATSDPDAQLLRKAAVQEQAAAKDPSQRNFADYKATQAKLQERMQDPAVRDKLEHGLQDVNHNDVRSLEPIVDDQERALVKGMAGPRPAAGPEASADTVKLPVGSTPVTRPAASAETVKMPPPSAPVTGPEATADTVKMPAGSAASGQAGPGTSTGRPPAAGLDQRPKGIDVTPPAEKEPFPGWRMTTDEARGAILDHFGQYLSDEKANAIRTTPVNELPEAGLRAKATDIQNARAQAAGVQPPDVPKGMNGFNDEGDIYVNSEGRSDVKAHELMHSTQNPEIKSQLGRNVNEAFTHSMTREVFPDFEIEADPTAYHQNGSTAVVDDMKALVGDDLVRRAYFGDGPAPVDALRDAVDAAKGKGTFNEAMKALNNGEVDYARYLLHK